MFNIFGQVVGKVSTVQTTRLVVAAPERIRFAHIDKDNFLPLVAPVDGVITDVTSTHPGDKIQAVAPPELTHGCGPILKIDSSSTTRIPARGDGLCRKIKAIPFQVAGDPGHPQYISPATNLVLQTVSRCRSGARLRQHRPGQQYERTLV